MKINGKEYTRPVLNFANMTKLETWGFSLDKMEVDALGLDAIDRRMLTTIIKHYGGGPVGLETLAAAIGEEAVTLEDVCEPYLMQIGFLARTPRGRCVTAGAYEYLGLEPGGRQEPEKQGEQLTF